jgi:metallo-beta-lactamase family protein
MKISFFGAAKTVTGSNYLLQTGNDNILVDCGLFQGDEKLQEKNGQPFLYDPARIKAVILTHAHLDHVGRLPLLVQKGFKGKIYATPPTIDLAKLVLRDAMEIQKELLFSEEDLNNIFNLFVPIEYHQETEITKDKVLFKFLDAGHILGSCIVEIFAEGKKIVFSGDLGNYPVPLLRPTEFPSSADCVIIESTYGSSLHNDFINRKDVLEDVIEETVKNKGVLLIPAFAIERTQELLFELNELVENNRIPRVPIYVDSPLAIESVSVYKRNERYYNKETTYLLRTGDSIFDFKGLVFCRTVEESKKINRVTGPKIIIAGSGMSTGGRILHHEKQYLAYPQNCLLFICFQVEGTLGRKIKDGIGKIEIFGEPINIAAKIKEIEGYSAHTDKAGLFRWLYSIKSSGQVAGDHLLKKVFVTHGEEEPANALSQIVKDELGIETIIPEINSIFEI